MYGNVCMFHLPGNAPVNMRTFLEHLSAPITPLVQVELSQVSTQCWIDPKDIRYSLTEVPIALCDARETGEWSRARIQPGLLRAYQTTPHLVPPIAVFTQGRRFLIYDGHNRVLNAKSAGLSHLWALVLVKSQIRPAKL